MKKIIDYYNIELIPGTLDKEVNDFIRDGWQPLGGAFSVKDNEITYWCQTMVKYEEGNSLEDDGLVMVGKPYFVKVDKTPNATTLQAFKDSDEGKTFPIGDIHEFMNMIEDED